MALPSLSELRARVTSLFTVERFIVGLLLVLALLTPLFFLPIVGTSVASSKMILVVFLSLFTFAIFLVVALIKGELILPKNSLIFAGLGAFGMTFLAALFSPALKTAFIGMGTEADTVFFIAILFLLMFLTTFLFQSHRRIFYLYLVFFTSFIIIAVIHILRFILGIDVLTFGILTTTTATLVGSWNDLAIFSGFTLISALFSWEFFTPTKLIRGFLIVVSILALFLLAVIHFYPVWVVVGLISLLLLLYIVSFVYWDGEEKTFKKGRGVPIFPIILLGISLVFIFAGPLISGSLNRAFAIEYAELRPSFATTMDIAGEALKKDPVFGAGPNRFSEAWDRYKPASLSGSSIQNLTFEQGSGFIPTLLVTVGVLGLLGWLFFIGLFLYKGIKVAAKKTLSPVSRYFILSSLMLATYLWVMAFLYGMGQGMLILMFLSTGVAIAIFAFEEHSPVYKISFVKDPRSSFFGILGVLTLLVLVFGGMYIFTTRFVGHALFQRGIQLATTNQEKGIKLMERGTALGRTDYYYRTLSRLRLEQLALLLSSGSSENVVKEKGEELLSQAIGYADQALRYDNTNYLNWVARGNVYGFMTQVNVEGALPEFLASYKKALELSPGNSILQGVVQVLENSKTSVPSTLLEESKALEQTETGTLPEEQSKNR